MLSTQTQTQRSWRICVSAYEVGMLWYGYRDLSEAANVSSGSGLTLPNVRLEDVVGCKTTGAFVGAAVADSNLGNLIRYLEADLS